jgi:hypothetical protein
MIIATKFIVFLLQLSFGGNKQFKQSIKLHVINLLAVAPQRVANIENSRLTGFEIIEKIIDKIVCEIEIQHATNFESFDALTVMKKNLDWKRQNQSRGCSCC